MALTIETGANVSGANSYITVDEYKAWADARFGARSTAPNCDEDVEGIILRAMDYFESLEFIGRKNEETQPLQWPRAWVCIDGYAIETNEIPLEVKTSIYELTYAEEVGAGEMNSIDRKTVSERVGPISVTYDSSSSRSLNVAPMRALRKLLKAGGGFVVSRA